MRYDYKRISLERDFLKAYIWKFVYFRKVFVSLQQIFTFKIYLRWRVFVWIYKHLMNACIEYFIYTYTQVTSREMLSYLVSNVLFAKRYRLAFKRHLIIVIYHCRVFIATQTVIFPCTNARETWSNHELCSRSLPMCRPDVPLSPFPKQPQAMK